MKIQIGNKIDFRRILSHAIFWLGCYVFFALISVQYGNFSTVLYHNLFAIPFDMFVVYFTIYFLIPKYLNSGKYWQFSIFFLFIALFMIYTQTIIVFKYIIKEPADLPILLSFEQIKTLFMLHFTLYYNFSIYALAVVIKLIKISYQRKIMEKDLEKKQIETELKLKKAELQLLKAQLHPHFLFNTLNNLYGLTIAKSDKAPDIVIKISELLDYMLYECNSNNARLINELKYLKNYIELEKIRYKNKLKVDYQESGITENHTIAPLILLPFMENCFKHGVSKQLNDSWININATVANESLDFSLSNSKVKLDNKNNENSKGIGIENVKRRLELLYKDNYNLEIQDLNDRFIVKLKLKLAQFENKVHYS